MRWTARRAKDDDRNFEISLRDGGKMIAQADGRFMPMASARNAFDDIPGVVRYLRGGTMTAYLEHAAVIDQGMRGMGIGSKLMRRVLAYVSNEGADRTVLFADPQDGPKLRLSLHRFYERLGFACLDNEDGAQRGCRSIDMSMGHYFGYVPKR